MKQIVVLFLFALTFHNSFSQACMPADKPDILYKDINGDGIDGDKNHAIFVDVNTGNDNFVGSMAQPVLTIEKGILLAASAGKDVYVAKGTYVLSNTLQLVSGVSLYGGFSGSPLWTRTGADTTIIQGPGTAVLAPNISLETHLEGFKIIAASAVTAGQSSYGVRVTGGTANTVIRFNTIFAGTGADGVDGTSGVAGPSGATGATGGDGSCDGSFAGAGGNPGNSACGAFGGIGGVGGAEGANNGIQGSSGAGGAVGGDGGIGGDPGGDGANGSPGATGSDGTNGTAAAAIGAVPGGLYVAADGSDGTDGLNGGGGGGGGGGAGQGCTLCDNGSGNGGGGGGSGGCGGTHGGKGTGGGGSFGILVSDGSALIERNAITTSNAGNGMNGGDGGAGGIHGGGGPGGAYCLSEIGEGGKGGDGGDGGNGGSGSGGTGGPSVGIFAAGNAIVSQGGNTIVVGLGGAAGTGGTLAALGQAPNGQAGASVATMGTTGPLVMDTPNICIIDTGVIEPASGVIFLGVAVALSIPAPQSITIQYTSTDGSASSTNSADYTPSVGSLTFQKDEQVKFISVAISHDNITEGDETFTLSISVPSFGTVTGADAIVTIHDLPTGLIDVSANNEGYALKQNSPNPTSGQTNISFLLPAQQFVSLQLFDLNGQLISTVAEGVHNEGWNTTTLNCDQLAGGVYLYGLKTAGGSIYKKLTVIR